MEKRIYDEKFYQDELAKDIFMQLEKNNLYSDVLAYYNYPLLTGGLDEEKISPTVCILSKKYGLINVIASSIINNDEESIVINLADRIDQIFYSRFIQNDSSLLKKGRDLSFDFKTIVFFNNITSKQIKIANSFNLPIVIHTRDAVMDTLEILKTNEVERKGVFHCCPLNRELVKEALKLGYYISFAGPITFKNSKNANEIIEMVPLERILIETDSPYLSPEPNRGKRNDSRNVKYIAEKVANVKHKSLEEIAKVTYENTCRIFNVK